MNNEELKEKIVDTMRPILKGTRVSCNEEDACEHCLFPCEVDRIVDRLADALIAAGIRDMSDIRSLADNVMLSVIAHKAEVSSMEQRTKEAEHRAEVAERALQKFAETITCEDCPFFSDCASSEKMEDLIHSSYCFAEYLRQAEKELAEEK